MKRARVCLAISSSLPSLSLLPLPFPPPPPRSFLSSSLSSLHFLIFTSFFSSSLLLSFLLSLPLLPLLSFRSLGIILAVTFIIVLTPSWDNPNYLGGYIYVGIGRGASSSALFLPLPSLSPLFSLRNDLALTSLTLLSFSPDLSSPLFLLVTLLFYFPLFSVFLARPSFFPS